MPVFQPLFDFLKDLFAQALMLNCRSFFQTLANLLQRIPFRPCAVTLRTRHCAQPGRGFGVERRSALRTRHLVGVFLAQAVDYLRLVLPRPLALARRANQMPPVSEAVFFVAHRTLRSVEHRIFRWKKDSYSVCGSSKRSREILGTSAGR